MLRHSTDYRTRRRTNTRWPLTTAEEILGLNELAPKGPEKIFDRPKARRKIRPFWGGGGVGPPTPQPPPPTPQPPPPNPHPPTPTPHPPTPNPQPPVVLSCDKEPGRRSKKEVPPDAAMPRGARGGSGRVWGSLGTPGPGLRPVWAATPRATAQRGRGGREDGDVRGGRHWLRMAANAVTGGACPPIRAFVGPPPPDV